MEIQESVHGKDGSGRKYYGDDEPKCFHDDGKLVAVDNYKNGEIDGLQLKEEDVEYWKDGRMAWKLPISEFSEYYKEELMDGLAMPIKASVVAGLECLYYVKAIHECVSQHKAKKELSFEKEKPPHLCQEE